jgi:hypothetical protein
MSARTILLSAACCVANPATALEVREWGTFTTFSSPAGTPVSWYANGLDSVPLPKFVRSSAFMLKQGPNRMRMETPVIYFYPEKPMEVTVKAAFGGGMITEMFPNTQTPFGDTVWKVNLLPPDDAAAAARIPDCPSGQIGSHYAAARAVPDAWIVSSKSPGLSVEGKPAPIIEEHERFIFYRGAGEGSSGLHVSMPDGDRIELRNQTTFVFPHQVVLRVEGDKAAWSPVPAAVPASGGEGLLEIRVPSSTRPVSEVTAELVSHFHERLAAEGLSAAESAAMVATWSNTWFHENGVRVFSIMPSALVDQMLPLEITPKPASIRRVFVLRSEMADPRKVALLTDLLWRGAADLKPDGYRDLRMGRFADGMRLAAIEEARQRMTNTFFQMRQAAETTGSAR